MGVGEVVGIVVTVIGIGIAIVVGLGVLAAIISSAWSH